MTRELLGRVSKASEELLGQNAGLRALRLFETKTEELLRRRALGTIGIHAEELTLIKHIRLRHNTTTLLLVLTY